MVEGHMEKDGFHPHTNYNKKINSSSIKSHEGSKGHNEQKSKFVQSTPPKSGGSGRMTECITCGGKRFTSFPVSSDGNIVIRGVKCEKCGDTYSEKWVCKWWE